MQMYWESSVFEVEKTGVKKPPVARCSLRANNGMIWLKRDKEKDRFYLLPGMGGKAMRRKNKKFLVWSIFAAAVVSFALALTLFLLNVH